MESSLHAASKSLVETMDTLAKAVSIAKFNEPLTLHAVTPHMQTLETSFGREVNTKNDFLWLAY